MGTKGEYRNSLRSKKMLREAFLDLLSEKDLDKITVTEIAQKADLNRRTFYAHYMDVQDLMEEIDQEAAEHISSFFNGIKDIEFWRNPISLLEAVTSYLQTDESLYRILLNSSTAAGFVDKMQLVFMDYMLNLPEFPEELRNQQDYKNRASFFAGGIAHMYVSWFCGKLGGTLEDLAYTLSRLISSDPIIGDIEWKSIR